MKPCRPYTLLLIPVLLCTGFRSSYAQAPDTMARRLLPTTAHKWSLSINPLGLLEFQPALGMGVGYQWNDRWQIWGEASKLVKPIWGEGFAESIQSTSTSHPIFMQGSREILTAKYYYGRIRQFFVGVEWRRKNTSYRDKNTFVSNSVPDTLVKYPYTVKNLIYGGAVYAGFRDRLTKDGRWRLECSIGLGWKYKSVSRQGVPDGYHYEFKPVDSGMPTASPLSSVGFLYTPGSIRIIYEL